MCECCCNALGSCFTCIYDITRSVPVWSTLAFVLFLVGHGLAINGRQATSREMNAMGLQGLTGWLDDLELALLFSLVFNGLSLLAAFLASGKTREVLFSKADYCCTSCLQFIIGRCTLGLVMAGCLAILLVDVLLLTAIASASSMILEVLGACSLAADLGPIAKTLQIVTGVRVPIAGLQEVCRSSLGHGFSVLVTGTILLVCSQIALIVAFSSNYTKIVLEPYLEKKSREKLSYGSTEEP
mmetsp:Transcript_5961/g.13974  ORF Transcript_5961/g.13974 Transcript_5961/m.13974 type:complete len:241 (-) Transcript_5961:97-819(-)